LTLARRLIRLRLVRPALARESSRTESDHARSEDIANAIREQNAQTPDGVIGAEPAPAGQEKQYNVHALGLLADSKQFEQIFVRSNPDGSQVKIKDVARVELGAQTTRCARA
jgi:multidrug efflux pump subunit AcrB